MGVYLRRHSILGFNLNGWWIGKPEKYRPVNWVLVKFETLRIDVVDCASRDGVAKVYLLKKTFSLTSVIENFEGGYLFPYLQEDVSTNVLKVIVDFMSISYSHKL